MTSGQQLQICLITSLSNTLLNDYRHLNGIARTLCVRRNNSWRPRHRRDHATTTVTTTAAGTAGTPSTHLLKRRRRPRPLQPLAPTPVSARKLLLNHSFSNSRHMPPSFMASGQVLRHRGLSNKSVSLDALLADFASDAGESTIVADDQPSETTPFSSPQVGEGDESSTDGQGEFILRPWRSSAPPAGSTPRETFETRSTRSSSTTSRNANRLSLTLPVAPANSTPSRPAPTPSIPPTPTETIGSGMASPADPNDFIVAIAAQERRVLELREELSRAEAELKTLQTRWNSNEAHKIRSSIRKHDPFRSAPDSSDRPANRRSLDIERKKALLMNATPREYKRRVMRGGHTRTLSLLSPTKSEHDFPIHNDLDVLRSPDFVLSAQNFAPAHLNKRATWAPRQQSPPGGVKQIAEDFRQGLWTFVEDLRQATVGDEGISATSNRTSDFQSRPNRRYTTDQDTIRPSSAVRGRVPFPEDAETTIETPSRTSISSSQDGAPQHQRNQSKSEGKARKHFSWTPLTSDDLGDDDWSSWDSPSEKRARWSGSTVNGDIIPAIPEKLDDNESVFGNKRSTGDLLSSSPDGEDKLGEMPSSLLNSLAPSKIKRFSSDFIKEWERSLSPPADAPSFEPTYQTVKDKAH